MSSELEGLSESRAPGRARLWGCPLGVFPSGAASGFSQLCRRCARVRVSRGAGRRLEGRWCHFINSGAQELRSSSRSPLLSFAGDSRRASASEPLWKSLTCRIPAVLAPLCSLGPLYPTVPVFLFYFISFFFLCSLLNYHSKIYIFFENLICSSFLPTFPIPILRTNH